MNRKMVTLGLFNNYAILVGDEGITGCVTGHYEGEMLCSIYLACYAGIQGLFFDLTGGSYMQIPVCLHIIKRMCHVPGGVLQDDGTEIQGLFHD